LPPGTGRVGEAAARSFVTEKLGYKIAATKFRTREGEIDIVATDDELLIFIEVKNPDESKIRVRPWAGLAE